MFRSKVRKLGLVAVLALIGLGALQGSASAAADGDLDISTLPPQAQWRINPGQVVAVNQGGLQGYVIANQYGH
jgi:hypothetical protein